MKDYTVILVRNQNKKDNIFNRILYNIIWHGSRSKYNHCQLLRELNGQLYICESTIRGFVITKTLQKWQLEQHYMQREYKTIDFNKTSQSNARFDNILGNKYNAKYWFYLIYYFEKWLNKDVFKNTKEVKFRGCKTIKATNCFQSVAYVLGIEDWHKASGNTF